LANKRILAMGMIGVIATIGIATAVTSMTGNAFAQSKSGGLCQEGHQCICTSNGVFHDLTTGFSINNGCTQDDL
jgi:hypothetical protein